jgi:GDP-L-fucose synthase
MVGCYFMTSSNNKIYVAGHNGMVGSAIVRQLKKESYSNTQLLTRTYKELDLTNQLQVDNFIAREKPDQIYLAAAKVGGIYANDIYPADFIYQNLMIQSNIINAAHKNNIEKILFLGSSCIYPKSAKQPMQERELLTGLLEPTNEPYAIAKIAGIKLCESYNRQYNHDYRSVMPTNLYGPGDNYHSENSHVIPSLIKKIHKAKIGNISKVLLWGSGEVKREFLHVDDMAAACLHVMNLDKENYQQEIKPMLSHINVGSGQDLTISNLAVVISKIIGYKGKIEFDAIKPDGPKKKLMDSTRLNSLGWKSKIDLEFGLSQVYKDYCKIYGM